MADKLPNPLNSGGSSDFLAFSTTSTNSGGGNNSSGSSDFLAFSTTSTPRAKGLLISKCPFGAFKSPKKNHEIFSRISALALTRGQIKKV